MSSYPTSIPTATNSQTTDTLAAAGHTALHNNLSAEVTAIATKLGAGSSVPAANTVLHGGVASSSWSTVDVANDVSGVMATSHGGTGTTSSSGTGAVVYTNNPTLVSASLTGGPSLQGGGVWAGGPTINQPTITDFTNSNHDHSSAAQGGVLTRLPQIQYQDVTTNSTQSNVLIQTGWSFITMDTTPASTKVITFPVAFDTLLSLVMTPNGETGAAADPTNINQGAVTVPTDLVDLMYGTRDVTTTGFLAIIKRNAPSDTSREIFSWVAIGVKA